MDNNNKTVQKFKQLWQLWGRLNSYLLFRRLIAVRKKELFSLVVLDLTFLYLQPGGLSLLWTLQ